MAVPGIPNLLVSATFTSDSYNIRLTDLANVWVESMERKPIVKRGLVEDTSIDPSDGPDQIRRMLELIRAAFDTSDAEHSNTSMTLGQDEQGSEQGSLVIHVTCVLPKPLKPFKWPMHLTKCPQSTLTTELVLPLIQAHQARSREIDTLLAALKEKDGVINRLVDKLDATGTGLEHVFNSLSGKRRVTRQIAEEKVKGLAPFPEADFRRGANEPQQAADSSDVGSLLDTVFGVTGLKYKADLDLEASSTLNDWWTKLGKGKHVVFTARPKDKTAHIPESLPTTETKPGYDDDDDFQVQATPPGLPSRRKREANTRPEAADDDETTDGEEESDIPDSLPLPLKKMTPSKPSSSRLGALGRRGDSPPSAPLPSAGGQNEKDGDSDTASDLDEDETTAPSPPKAPARRGGLGRIGGRARETTPPAKLPRSPSPGAPEKDASPPIRKHKLGAIGKKAPSAEPTTYPESGSEDGRGRSNKPSPAAALKSRPRETSQERADRKRVQLEEELRKKAAAGPAKKKRKF